MGREKDSGQRERENDRYEDVVSSGHTAGSADSNHYGTCDAQHVSAGKEEAMIMRLRQWMMRNLGNKKGMEMVQVAILVAIAVAAGIIFKSSVVDFVNKIFKALNAANF